MNRVLLEHSRELVTNNFVVNWCMGNQCNYRCSYCNPTLNSGDRSWVTIDIVKKITNELLSHMEQTESKKKIIFELTGGEITLNKDLPEILKFLKEKGCDTCLISNASQSIEYWHRLSKYLDYCIFSFHADHCRKDHFLNVLSTLRDNVNLVTEIMMHPEKYDLCKEIGNEISRKYPEIIVCFQPIFENLAYEHTLKGYTKEQKTGIEELQKGVLERNKKCLHNRYRSSMRLVYEDGSSNEFQAEQLIAEKNNNWYGWLCWAGCEQIVISQDGDVFRAWCCQDWIGNVKKTKVKFPKFPTICQRNICHCNLDIMTRKQKLIRITHGNDKIDFDYDQN